MCDISMERFHYVIVLCPSEWKTSTNGKDRYFDELNSDEKRKSQVYLGGQVRMEAAADIASYVDNFIVVGGNEKKVTDMRDFLLQESQKILKEGEIAPKIIRIESEPDTTGNLWAIKKWREKHKISFSQKRIGIITNFYHLLRATRFVIDIFPEYSFVPLTAEGILKRHLPTFNFYPKEFLLRVLNEVDGLRDWESSLYRDQNKVSSEWRSICHDEELLDHLEKGD